MLAEVLTGVGLAAFLVLLHGLAWRSVVIVSALIRRLGSRVTAAALWERTHPLRAGLRRRCPRCYRFAARRLDPSRPGGLPLTLGVAAVAYIAALIGGVVEELLEADELLAFDYAVNGLLDPIRTESVVHVFAWITSLGNSGTMVAVALVTTAFLWAYHRVYCIFPLWVTQLGAQATTYLGKFVLDRERPEYVTGITAATPSFPSGHATSAMAVYGFIAFLLVRERFSLRERFEIVYWSAALIAAVGFSRMYLSVHYASDVATGFLVGGFWLLVGIMLAENRIPVGRSPTNG